MRNDIYDRLFVKVFNKILKLEQKHLRENKDINLSMSEIHTLDAINRMKNSKMREIASSLHVTLSTLTISVNNLIRKGYVTNQRVDEDKRVVNLSLTPKAKKVVKAHGEFHENMINEMLCDLNDEEKKVLEHTLDKLCNYFTKLA